MHQKDKNKNMTRKPRLPKPVFTSDELQKHHLTLVMLATFSGNILKFQSETPSVLKLNSRFLNLVVGSLLGYFPHEKGYHYTDSEQKILNKAFFWIAEFNRRYRNTCKTPIERRNAICDRDPNWPSRFLTRKEAKTFILVAKIALGELLDKKDFYDALRTNQPIDLLTKGVHYIRGLLDEYDNLPEPAESALNQGFFVDKDEPPAKQVSFNFTLG